MVRGLDYRLRVPHALVARHMLENYPSGWVTNMWVYWVHVHECVNQRVRSSL
jgi:hypothetical protein